MKKQDEIFFAGDGHGAIAALKSLMKYFVKIEVVTNDKSVTELIRQYDLKVESIDKCKSQVGVFAGYKKIVSNEFLKQKICINTHPTILPKYRGLHGLVWAMLNGEEELGFSIHLMNEFIDDGPILEQYKINYTGQTSSEIMDCFDNYVEANLGKIVYDYLNNRLLPKDQNLDEATWVCKRDINDCVIDYNYDVFFLKRMFRALVYPYPLPMIKIKNDLFEILDSKIIERDYYMHNGRVVNIQDDFVYIKVKNGFLCIKKLRDYNTKQVLIAKDILKIGQRL